VYTSALRELSLGVILNSKLVADSLQSSLYSADEVRRSASGQRYLWSVLRRRQTHRSAAARLVVGGVGEEFGGSVGLVEDGSDDVAAIPTGAGPGEGLGEAVEGRCVRSALGIDPP
jgi:hypothetical protein